LFSQHPLDGIHNVAFSTPIGTKQAGYPIGKLQVHLIGKRLESVYFQTLQKQDAPSFRLTQYSVDYSIGLPGKKVGGNLDGA
jgi:hypothetical protein